MKIEMVLSVSKDGIYKIKSKNKEVKLIGNINNIKTLILNEYTEGIVNINGIKNLEKIVFDDSSNKINSKVSSFNHKIKEVILPKDLKCIEFEAFYHCSNLETINFNSKLETICGYSFCGCSSIKTLDFSKVDNLRDIEPYAFVNCVSLEEIIFNNIPEFSYNSFYRCSNIKTINLNINGKNKVIQIPDGYIIDYIEGIENSKLIIEYTNNYNLHVTIDFDMPQNCNYRYTILDKCDFVNNNIIIPKNYNNVRFLSKSLKDLNDIDSLDLSNIEGNIYLDISDINSKKCIKEIILPNINKDRKVEIKLSKKIKVGNIKIIDDRINMLEDNNKNIFKIKDNHFIESIISNGECYILKQCVIESLQNKIIASEDKIDDTEKLYRSLDNNLLREVMKSKNIPYKYIKDIEEIMLNYAEFRVGVENQIKLIKK